MSKWNWKETEVGKSVQGKSGFTRFVGWINSLFNENHSWFDYDKMDKSLSSVKNQLTQEGLTGQQVAMNDLQMQNVEDQYQRQVSGMQKAGINPALMFQSGSSSAPSASPSASNGVNMSEIMQLSLLPLQAKMLKAQTANVNADTYKKEAETGKIGYEIDEIREKIRGLGLSNEQERIILSYLDRMQSAELAIKESSKKRLDMDIKSIEQNIHNMSAEECATYISMLETIEKMNTLVSEQDLNQEFGKYYAKLCSNLEAQNKILKLQERDWDYINVVGSTSFSTGVGPFKGSESRPVTLHDLKNTAEKVGREKAEQKKNSNKSWEEIKNDASAKYGALE